MFHIPISGLKYLCAKYTFCFILIGEKRLRTSEDTRDPPAHKVGEQRTPQPQDVEGGEVDDVVEIVTTTGQCLTPQIHVMCMLWKNKLQKIMVCSRDLDTIKQKTNEVEQKLKNMIDILGRI
ncbi:hypothetical protein AB205_0022600 [Aquarana catesbeiana]|uniref:Uncharacterized protein n=1 Tax=Aquarana catesbeiana TaxID=8400 RepID=A0A2G9QJK5_AQUCT|nr:hypothetical protein AB205_0022600 [Aquarana catesbeiana]